MTLKSDMATALDKAFTNEVFGEEVVYNGTPIQAIVDYGESPERSGMNRSRSSSGSSRNEAEIEVRIADVPDPKYRDKIMISGVTWFVLQVIEKDFFSSKLALFTDERVRL